MGSSQEYNPLGYWANADVFEDVPLTAQPVYEIKDGFNFFIGRIEYSGAISPGIVRWGQGISYTTARNERIEKLGYQVTMIRLTAMMFTSTNLNNSHSRADIYPKRAFQLHLGRC